MDAVRLLSVADIYAELQDKARAREHVQGFEAEALRRYHEASDEAGKVEALRRFGRKTVEGLVRQRRLGADAMRLWPKPESEVTTEERRTLEEKRRVCLERWDHRAEKRRRRMKRLEERTAPARWERVREKLKAIGPVWAWPDEMYGEAARLGMSPCKVERLKPHVLGRDQGRRLLGEMFEQEHGFDMTKWEPFKYTPPKPEPRATASETREEESWPEPLGTEAFHGLAGEIVRAISPQTEADEAALVMQVLVSFGVLVGRGPHIRVESDRHCGNLFALIVGDTAKARKGTSWGRIKDIFARIRSANVLASWPPVVEGLSSGEGLKWAVRDPSATPAKKGGQSVVDPGVVDKRLLVVESEFAQVLRQCARAGNTLSAIIRVAWDGGKLQTLTKNDPITATGAHIAIIGHITAAELRAELTQTDTANGFANRFILMCAKRSKMLPFGGDQMDEAVMSHFAARLGKAAGKAMSLGPVSMADDARQLWGAVYPELSQGHPGLFGAVTARAEAQCLRLALSYALLDELTVIKAEHVKAALAVWKRAEASARHLFGQALGDSVADAIRGALRQAGAGGMTRTQISALFLRHHNAERIQAALNLLQSRGLARFEKQLTAGAPKEIWLCA